MESFDRPFSIVQLHARVINRLGAEGREKLLNETPYHIAADDRMGSIVLFPICPAVVDSNPSQYKDWRVLIEVTTATPPPTPYDWRTWLMRYVPRGVGFIELQSVHESRSSALILAVPIEVWDMLPHRESYLFITHVRSSNLLLKTAEAKIAALQLELKTKVKKLACLAAKDATIAQLQAQLNQRQPRSDKKED